MRNPFHLSLSSIENPSICPTFPPFSPIFPLVSHQKIPRQNTDNWPFVLHFQKKGIEKNRREKRDSMFYNNLYINVNTKKQMHLSHY